MICEPGVKSVDHPALRNPAPVRRFGGQDVAFDHYHGSVKVGEHSRGQQSGHARAEHYSVITQFAYRAERAIFDHGVKKALRIWSKPHSNE
jgi:hypothetical protein